MTTEIFAANRATTTVTSGGTDAPPSGNTENWVVASSTGFPAASGSASPPTQFHVADPAAPSEMIAVTNVSDTTWNVIRGAESTTPVTHSAGFTVYQVVTAGFLENLSQIPVSDQVFNVKYYGAIGNGVNDDTAAIQAAINAALAVATTETSTVFLPAGIYIISATLNCSNATVSAGGYGVLLRGAGHQATRLYKASSFGPALYWEGYSGSTYPSAFGGMIDMSVEGNATTGGLVKLASCQQMFFRGCSFTGSSDIALECNTVQDSYWAQCTWNTNGSTTAPVVSIYGSSSGTSNMLWFSQCRIEDFPNGSVWIKAGAGAVGGNNGFFFSQCKFETGRVNGDLIYADGYTQQLLLDQCFFAMDSFNGGYSTPANCVTFGDGATGIGGNQFSITNAWIHAASGVMNSVVNVNGAEAISGPVTIGNINADSSPVTAALIFNGALQLNVNFWAINVPGTLLSGDGTYYNSVGNDAVSVFGSGIAFVNWGGGNVIPSMPSMFNNGSGIVVLGVTSETGVPTFGAGNSTSDGNVGGTGFIVLDNNQVWTLYNQLDDGSGNVTIIGVSHLSGGTDTSGIAAATIPSISSGSATTINTTQDVMLYADVKTASSFTFQMGAVSPGTATTLFANATAAVGMMSVRVPKGWYVNATFTTADITWTAITC
jgi:hypothetical protein